MYEPDQENTTFIMNQGLYCYNVMPFGLKNTRAIYQMLVNRIFADLLGKSMEVFMDDVRFCALGLDIFDVFTTF